MRRQAALPLILLLLVACGGGGDKQAFADYENRVGPLLEEDGRIWRRFEEAAKNVLHYGADRELRDFVRTTLVPFTARFKTKVEAMEPVSEKLQPIHAYLIDYAQLRSDLLAVFAQMDALDQRVKEEAAPTRKQLVSMMKQVEEKGKAIQPAFLAAPEFARSLGETLQQIMASAQHYQELLEDLDAGKLPSARYVQEIDGRLLPWLGQMKIGIGSLAPDVKGVKLQVAVLAYVNEMEALIKASRPLAEIRAKAEKEGMPIQQRLRTLNIQSARTLATYTEDAKAFRDRLR